MTQRADSSLPPIHRPNLQRQRNRGEQSKRNTKARREVKTAPAYRNTPSRLPHSQGYVAKTLFASRNSATKTTNKNSTEGTPLGSFERLPNYMMVEIGSYLDSNEHSALATSTSISTTIQDNLQKDSRELFDSTGQLLIDYDLPKVIKDALSLFCKAPTKRITLGINLNKKHQTTFFKLAIRHLARQNRSLHTTQIILEKSTTQLKQTHPNYREKLFRTMFDVAMSKKNYTVACEAAQQLSKAEQGKFVTQIVETAANEGKFYEATECLNAISDRKERDQVAYNLFKRALKDRGDQAARKIISEIKNTTLVRDCINRLKQPGKKKRH